MMTSRTEYRLLHRQDNADQRLTPIGHRIGLVDDETYQKVVDKYAAVDREIQRLEHTGVASSPELEELLRNRGESAPKGGSAKLGALLRRPRISYDDLAPFNPQRPRLDKAVREAVEISMKYEGYIARQLRQVEEFRKMEGKTLPPDTDYLHLEGLRLEAREKLDLIRPLNLGQASRISGVSPADVAALMIYLEKRGKSAQEN